MASLRAADEYKAYAGKVRGLAGCFTTVRGLDLPRSITGYRVIGEFFSDRIPATFSLACGWHVDNVQFAHTN
jgi:hypothetical protein